MYMNWTSFRFVEESTVSVLLERDLELPERVSVSSSGVLLSWNWMLSELEESSRFIL